MCFCLICILALVLLVFLVFFFILVKWHCLEKPVGKNIQEYEKLGKDFY